MITLTLMDTLFIVCLIQVSAYATCWNETTGSWKQAGSGTE